MKSLSLALILSVSTILVHPAGAQDCSGDQGYSLTATPQVASLGDPVELSLTAPPQDLVIFLVSAGPGPVNTQVGPLCVSFPLLLIYPTSMPPCGQLTIPTYMHCQPALNGFTYHLQFASFATDGSNRSGRSNMTTVTGSDDGNGCNFCIRNTKAAMLRMRYTGDNCAASHHSQDPSAVTCEGDPAFAPSVRIIVQDKPYLTSGHRSIYFDGIVALNGIFDIEAAAIGRSRMKGETYILALDASGNVIHRVGFHTSCSQPLHGYDQFGAFSLLAFVAE
ncbi:MAG: hypothetical protein V2A76_10610 [Planctomycetota bacterium]